MKRIIYISGIVLIVISVISCNDDFLSKNKVNLYLLSDTVKLNNTLNTFSTPVQLPLMVNSDYTVYMHPKWLSFSTMHGAVTDGSFLLDFDIMENDIISGYQTHYGTIMINIEDIGIISMTVSYENFGSPTLQCIPSGLKFESLEPQTLTITNTTEGLLNWEITEIPEWLYIFPPAGTLFKNYSITVTVTVLQDELLANPQTSTNLKIVSNSVTGNLNIPVEIDESVLIPSQVLKINGIVVDAEYSMESGIMVIVTKSPDKLIVFNTSSNNLDTLLLSATPGCISISEDGDKAVIGYNSELISYIDVTNIELIRDYTVDCIPFDIVLGNNGWSYIAPEAGQWTNLRNLDLVSGELSSDPDWSEFYEKSIIRKIHGKPYLIGTRTTISPSGILIFDISKGMAGSSITYYHTSVDRFWISKNGSKLFTHYKTVFNLPSSYDWTYHPFDPPMFGQIVSSSPNITAFDESTTSSTFFVASTCYDNDPQYNSIIEQYYMENLQKIRTFSVAPVYVTENGNKELYKTSARYLFAKKNSLTLYVIKNIREYYHKDYWTIDAINTNK